MTPIENAFGICFYFFLSILLASLLAGCGGGGGGGGASGSSSVSVSTTPVAAVCAASGLVAPLADASAPAAVWSISSGSARTYAETPAASEDLINPMRGYHRWINREQVPQASPSQVVYNRFFWKSLETAEGVYDFSALLAEASAAKAQGKKYAFRLRMMNGDADASVYLPDYVYKNSACAHECGFTAAYKAMDPVTYALLPAVYSFVPDWNDAWLQTRAKALLVALRDALKTAGIELAWIDVGLYGQYGEWYVRPTYYLGSPQGNVPAGVTAITAASKQAFARMHFEVFPDVQHVMFAKLDQLDALSWGLSQTLTSKPVGLRTDCLGKTLTLGEWESNPASFALIQDQWKKAPFIAEFCSPDSGKNVVDLALASSQITRYHISTLGNGQIAPKASSDIDARWSFLTSDEQSALIGLGRQTGYRYFISESGVSLNADGSLRIRAALRNGGSAPSYESWKLNLELVDAAGAVAASQPLSLNLQDNLGNCSSQLIDTNWNPAVSNSGSYTLRIAATHSFWPRLKWAQQGRNTDGSLPLATVLRK
ncbi:DUF4832 domain-containing protein [Uliginosibacterium sp. 31-12]|uniref:DUF4832 domain-containing protein n=1 Tax=Uliginosibacterium sp. 31-12 TaxID=3062781 RepID=UPI0026E356CC|nr:DUF4832 domain-containing protein [Uliginosibacterium sp. 31-12]MDO6387001.1 DUF4832 domain-containing protein [Uliginosibacterium sp. 31-12]